MLATLADPILPIFAILAVGFGLHRIGLFDIAAAQAINKFVFYVATPALVFSIIANAPVAELDLRALGVYLATQIVVYVGTFLVMHRCFGRDKGEALLLGMTAAFVNHVFFVLPIAERIHGVEAAQPIGGIVLMDVVLVFCGTVLVVDLMQARNPSPRKVAAMLAKNPFLIAAALGAVGWVARPMLPQGLFTYARFAGGAAAPASLFALGIILASRPIWPIGPATWTVVGAKILVHPALLFAFAGSVAVTSQWGEMTLLVAAGPCGAMPFVIALRYGITTETIAKAVLVSTVLSLLSLSLLSGQG